jgi:hypothetical protein
MSKKEVANMSKSKNKATFCPVIKADCKEKECVWWSIDQCVAHDTAGIEKRLKDLNDTTSVIVKKLAEIDIAIKWLNHRD